jgi:acetylornithine deacetylase
MTEIEKLLINLIKIPSVSGNEKLIGEFIISRLNDFKITKQNAGKDRFNIIAKKGISSKWLVTHMDTVPGELPLRITKDKIFGRGACDNKQSIAGSILVGNKIKNINLLFTVGEETDFIGARLARKNAIKGDFVIVQEPTDFKVITSQRGIIEFEITTKGKSGHSSAEKIKNANHKLIKVLTDLEKNKWSSFNIGVLSGGVAANVVAVSATATVSVRPKNIIEYKSVIEALKKIENKVKIKNCFRPYKNKLFFPEKECRCFTEMFFFKNSILFGAGNIKLAHSDQENISRKQLNLLPLKLIELLS